MSASVGLALPAVKHLKFGWSRKHTILGSSKKDFSFTPRDLHGLLAKERDLHGLLAKERDLHRLLAKERDLHGLLAKERDLHGLLAKERDLHGLLAKDSRAFEFIRSVFPAADASEQARAFLACCMVIEPTQRLSALRLLKHGFLADASGSFDARSSSLWDSDDEEEEDHERMPPGGAQAGAQPGVQPDPLVPEEGSFRFSRPIEC